MKRVFLFLLIFLPLKVVAPDLSFEQAFDLRYRTVVSYQALLYQREFDKFAQQLGKRESTNNWKAVNPYGCIGEWQFTISTLKALGFKNVTYKAFKDNPNIFTPEMQKKALQELVTRNLKGLQPYMKYVGKIINGTLVTKSGLIAGMHLGGLGSVQKYLASNGTINATDANGTQVSDYIREFAGFSV